MLIVLYLLSEKFVQVTFSPYFKATISGYVMLDNYFIIYM
jgi:hypothetical protein